MSFRLAVVVLSFLVISAAAAESKGKAVTLQDLAALLPKEEPRPAGKGLLVLDVRLRDIAAPTEGSAKEFKVGLRALAGGKPRSFTVPWGAPSVLTLDAGRYCIDTILFAGHRREVDCAPPHFDVNADSVDFSGRLAISMSGRHGPPPVSEAILDRDTGLDAEQLAMINTYLDHAAEKGPRLFLLSGPTGEPSLWRLFPDGTAEREGYLALHPVYQKSRWTGDLAREVEIDFAGYRFRREGDGWMARSVIRDPIKGVSSSTEEQVAVTTRVECWHWAACGRRFASNLLLQPDYTFAKSLRQLHGRIELEFGIEPYRNMARPAAIRVVGGDLPEPVATEVRTLFGDTRWHADELPTDPVARFRVAIDFRWEGDRFVPEMGTLTPVERPAAGSPRQ